MDYTAVLVSRNRSLLSHWETRPSEVETMADVVTKFMCKTCRIRPPLRDCALFALQCSASRATRHPKDDVEAEMMPLSTGSAAEFYIEPMLPCVGDVDIMFYYNTCLAVPEECPPPTQLPDEFHSRVLVSEIVDSQFPGYVYLELRYLLAECRDDGKYAAVVHYDSGMFVLNRDNLVADEDIHGPAVFTPGTVNVLSVDSVFCVRCLMWPPQAADWPTRHRNYGWPDSATVDRVVSNGCDVVRVAHRQCRQDEWMSKHQWRLSFSRAEIVLINSWMPEQQIMYHMLRVFVKAARLTDSADNSGTFTLSNYHIKTLMLWACELKPKSWWTDDLNLVRICVQLLHTLADWLTDARCQHYFINSCNLLASDCSFDARTIAKRLLAIDEASLSTWFINSYIRSCSKRCPAIVSRLFNDVSTSMKLENAVSAVVDCRINSKVCEKWPIFRSFQYHIMETRLQLLPDFTVLCLLAD